ncbi:hypothetical protein SEA_BABYDOTZ_49 [Microbacterium phage BabyDotz]|nr:hypothetical protein SEA_BABYDOTZ_49 [Microbacterium phage BabyDotz]
MSTHAILALKNSLEEAETDLGRVRASTADEIEAGRRAEARLTAAQQVVDSLQSAIQTLEEQQRGAQRDA